MTKPDLMAELAEVVRLLETKAMLSREGEGAAADFYLIQYEQASSAFIHKRRAELEAVVRKAKRYDWLASRTYVQDRDGGWSSAYHFYAVARHDGSTYKGAIPYRYETLDAAIDHAMHNSAREG